MKSRTLFGLIAASALAFGSVASATGTDPVQPLDVTVSTQSIPGSLPAGGPGSAGSLSPGAAAALAALLLLAGAGGGSGSQTGN